MRRYIGIMLLVVFFVYSFKLLRNRKEDGAKNNVNPNGNIRKELALIAVAIAGVIFGARFTVESAVDIALHFGAPATIIGATLVAFWTSLPELTVDVRASTKGHLDIAIGDVIRELFPELNIYPRLAVDFHTS